MKSTNEVPQGERFGILLDKTNFYAEQGGQEADYGKLVIDGEADFTVDDVQVYAGYVLHTGYLGQGELSVGGQVIAEFDELRRNPIRNNHTGTHVLNYALREVLGNEVDQKGSLVAPEKLRFDFSHKAGLSDAELEKVEQISSEYIKQDTQVYAKDVPLATAREINGLRAVFGETYPDPVRVVSVGKPVEDLIADPKNEAWSKLSIEFCGGTHVLKTGEIKELVIIEESGIAKGIRRVIAVTGQEAYNVQRIANNFSERLDALKKLKFGPQKENDAKRTQVDLNNLTISALTKSRLRDRMAKISKSILDEQKAAAKAEQKKVLDAVTKHFEDDSNKFLVQKVEYSSTMNKTISDVIKTVSGPKSAIKDRSLYLFAASPEEGKVVHGCYVSEVSLRLTALKTRDEHFANILTAVQGQGRRRPQVGCCRDAHHRRQGGRQARRAHCHRTGHQRRQGRPGCGGGDQVDQEPVAVIASAICHVFYCTDAFKKDESRRTDLVQADVQRDLECDISVRKPSSAEFCSCQSYH